MGARASARASGLIAASLIAATVGAAFVAGGPEAQRRFAGQRMATELRQLAYLAGVRDAKGTMLLPKELPVAVVQQGGPLWIREDLASVVDDDGALRIADGPHRVMVEVVGTSPAIALRLSLERRGWLLRSERAIRLRTAPWIAVAAAVLGVFTLRWIRRLGAAFAVAGFVTQTIVAFLPWPTAVAPRDVVDAWTSGPLGDAVLRLATSLPDESFAIGIGVVVLCTMLIWFDHRRSRRSGGTLLLWGVLGTVGGLAWLEAGARLGGVAAASGVSGWISLAALVGLYVAGWRRFVTPRGRS